MANKAFGVEYLDDFVVGTMRIDISYYPAMSHAILDFEVFPF